MPRDENAAMVEVVDNTKINTLFRNIVGENPYEFQKNAMENLSEGRSLIVRAPTGSGKTEIAIIPFILGVNNFLPSQLIYSLPTRTLVESIGERAIKYASFKKLRTAIHHGKKATSSLFEEDIIVTTIDQTAGAYLSVPLSMPKKWGNIFIGGVASALTVFDEVHTLHPEKGLQTATAISMQSAKLDFPSVIMSATLPDVFITKTKERIERNSGKVEVIDVEDESEIKSRKNRKVYLYNRLDKQLTSEKIKKEFEENKKLIVIVNTVDRAQKLFLELKDNDLPVILLHSRFLEEDRIEKETKLKEIFGKDGKKEGIFISTQVIEVGMDISSPKILSEIAPIDSLIQRAGRCARWGGKGEFHVFNLPSDPKNPYLPYSKDLIEATKSEINKKGKEFLLNWQTELELINKILSRYFEIYMDDFLFFQRIGEISRAVYDGNRASVEQNIREIFSCDITLHEDIDSLNEEEILKLPKIRLDARILIGKFDWLYERGIKIYKIEENPFIGEYESKYRKIQIKDKEDILPFELYILSGSCYSSDVGLLLDCSVSDGVKSFSPETQNLDNESVHTSLSNLREETWIEHAKNTLYILDNYLIPKYSYVIRKFADYFDYSYNEFIRLIRCIVALHDLGKLNIEWQKKVGWNGKEPLAHSTNSDIKRLPPHATVSARALQPYLEEIFNDKSLFKAFYSALAHHHTPRAKEFGDYKLIPKYENIISEIWDIPIDLIKASCLSGRLNPDPSFNLAKEAESYRLYGLLSKLLRISDRLATGGENYESIFSN